MFNKVFIKRNTYYWRNIGKSLFLGIFFIIDFF